MALTDGVNIGAVAFSYCLLICKKKLGKDFVFFALPGGKGGNHDLIKILLKIMLLSIYISLWLIKILIDIFIKILGKIIGVKHGNYTNSRKRQRKLVSNPNSDWHSYSLNHREEKPKFEDQKED